jgi:anti-sigma-K factor RskA
MNGSEHIPQEELYLFALQLLPEAEAQTVAQHLKQCGVCRAAVAEIQGDLAMYALSTEMKTPPAEARERLMRQVAAEKKVIPIVPKQAAVQQPVAVEPMLSPRSSRMFQMDAAEEQPRRRVAPFLAWTGWAVAAGLAVVAGMQFQQRQADEQMLSAESARVQQETAQTAEAAQAKVLMQTLTDANAMQVSLHVPLTAGAPPKLDPEGHATYVPGKGALVFVASHLDPLPPAKTYELWLLPAEAGQAPVPAGLFKPDASGNATVVMPPLPKEIAAKGFGVTVEDDGGSKTPTAPIVLAGL